MPPSNVDRYKTTLIDLNNEKNNMVYFISDVHLGTTTNIQVKTHIQRFTQLLEQMAKDATHVFLLGDIFDFWYEYFLYDPAKKKYDGLFDVISQMTSQNIEVHFFVGNHDLWTFGYLEKRTGIIVHKGPWTTTLASKRLYLAHGDGLVPTYLTQSFHSLKPRDQNIFSEHEIKKIERFMQLRRFHRNPIAQFCFRLLPPFLGNRIGKIIAKRGRIKEVRHPCQFKGADREELILFAKERETFEHFDFYVFGHRHIFLDFPLNEDSHVIFLGDFFRQWTYAVLSPDGKMRLLKKSFD